MSLPAKLRPTRLISAFALLVALVSFAAEPAKNAPSPPQWLREGVVYEVFPRNFSPEGSFDGIPGIYGVLRFGPHVYRNETPGPGVAAEIVI